MPAQRDVFFAYAGQGLEAPIPACAGTTLHREHLDWCKMGTVSWCNTRLPADLFRPGAEIIPCLSALLSVPYGFQFSLCVNADGAWHDAPFAPVGKFVRPMSGEENEFVHVDTDIATVIRPVSDAYMSIFVDHEHAMQWPDDAQYLITVLISNISGDEPVVAARQGKAECYGIPVFSQFEVESHERDIMCSPTSVAMVFGYHFKGSNVLPIDLARQAHFPGIGAAYGVWPANIMAASRYGLAGYVFQFPNWESARYFLDKGFPIVASIRYKAFALEGAPKNATPYGHMVVLAGYENDTVLVYDPAAPDSQTVRRRYSITQFCDAWFNHHAVGYVLFPPS